MASLIFLNIREQKSLTDHMSENPDRPWKTSPWADHFRPVIAKGNIIEGIEAKE